MALFGENYADVVRMVSISDESKELCGGTHVGASGEIGCFFIVSETGIAAGVRRIEAVVGAKALAWIQNQRATIATISGLLKIAPDGIVDKMETVLARERDLVREVEQLKRKVAGSGTDLMDKVRDVEGIAVLGSTVEIGDPATLRDTADTLRQKLGSGVVCLAGKNGDKAALVVAITKDLVKHLNAGLLIREVASVVGGRGGGRPDMAQAGGPDPTKLDEAALSIYDAVARARKEQARGK